MFLKYEEYLDEKIKNPGLLEIPDGKKAMDLDWEHIQMLCKKKGKAAILKGLLNLYSWNVKKNPPLSNWAKEMRDRVKDEIKESANSRFRRKPINENTKFYGTAVNDYMEEEGIDVGKLIKNVREFKKRQRYCYLDGGYDEWTADLVYLGLNSNGIHEFIYAEEDGGNQDGKIPWTSEELERDVKAGLFAYQLGL